MRRQILAALGSSALLVLGLVACGKSDESAKNAAREAAARGAVPAPASPAVTVTETAFVTTTALLKREGSDKPKVDDGKGKQVTNWLTTLYRGEKVSIGKIAQGGENVDYVLVKTSNDMAGWIRSNALLAGSDVREATTLEQIDTFDRPDLLTLNAKRKVAAGSLLFVTKQREQFSEVNIGGTQTVWVLSANLVGDANEIMVAKLLAKARGLKEGKSGGVEDLVNLARNSFKDARLVGVMEQEFGMAAGAAPAPLAAPPAAATEGGAAETKSGNQ